MGFRWEHLPERRGTTLQSHQWRGFLTLLWLRIDKPWMPHHYTNQGSSTCENRLERKCRESLRRFHFKSQKDKRNCRGKIRCATVFWKTHLQMQSHQAGRCGWVKTTSDPALGKDQKGCNKVVIYLQWRKNERAHYVL